jgi:hypothetical protein
MPPPPPPPPLVSLPGLELPPPPSELEHAVDDATASATIEQTKRI